MPEINPLSNEQIFLKKIAENTGSDYNTGDVSEINPLSIDQILLKEIAANTEGQSGDITELEEKVTSNAEAIEAIVNENGCCNVCPPTNYNNLESYGVYYTTNADKSITAQGTTGSDPSSVPIIGDYIPNKYVGYKLSGCVGGSNETYFINVSYSNDGSTWATDNYQYDEPITVANYPYIKIWLAVKAGVTINTTFYPMLYDARLKPTGYVPYAMTNRELTERALKFVEIPYSAFSWDNNVKGFIYNNPPSEIINAKGFLLNPTNIFALLGIRYSTGANALYVFGTVPGGDAQINSDVIFTCYAII